MKQYEEMSYHPLMEKVTELLQQRTQNDDPHFFRLIISTYMAQMASSMRCKVSTQDRGVMPVNMYNISLALSGSNRA